ncbi:PHA accumulation regulator DNA-binding-like [Trichodesmium erythraeum IMS101]|uniref:PHA accumulation regulator DNA-binding-like n=1 Tax=Trichodesmium erythraeum (strain IMS101) TaxID=203124 RepID=Q112G8_TRIEI|nr:type IV pilin-like G/H family protein [Trichodesmium erythraeum GBRTRLIN201]
MKTEFKAKFLQHVAKKRKEEGFTLIELLVVIIIIGILSAIALPSFLNQANKAKQSEAKQYIASIAKGQQAYYAEKGTFITAIADIGKLGLGIRTGTNNYTYELVGTTAGAGGVNAWTKNAAQGLKYYAGLIYLTQASGALTSETALCESGDQSKDAATNQTAPTATATKCADTGGFTVSL